MYMDTDENIERILDIMELSDGDYSLREICDILGMTYALWIQKITLSKILSLGERCGTQLLNSRITQSYIKIMSPKIKLNRARPHLKQKKRRQIRK